MFRLVQDEKLLEFVAENTYQYYLAQNTDTIYTNSLQKAFAETEKSISNLLRAIEAGIFNESTVNTVLEYGEDSKTYRGTGDTYDDSIRQAYSRLDLDWKPVTEYPLS